MAIELTRPGNFQIKVVNVLGQVVYEENLKNIAGKYQKVIDLSSHAKGVYTLQLISGEGMVNKKVVIQ